MVGKEKTSGKIGINFGDPVKTWSQYGLEEYPIYIDGEDTPYKAIFRDNQLVKMLGSDYYLFPNEEALKIANKAADLVGLNPFPATAPGLISRDNVLYNRKETKMRAIYTYGKIEKINGDEVNVGINVFNAIDGTSSFGCGLFTYRYICGNGVIIGKESIMSVRRVHTKGMEKTIEDLKNKMILIMEEGVHLIDKYRFMAEKRITDKLVDMILNSRLPAKILPDYITEEEAELPDLSQWNLYNDITEAIWHNEKAGLHTKTFQFNTLHKILPTR